MDQSKSAELKEAQSQLTEGLKSCRSVLNNYRSLLADEQGTLGPSRAREVANDVGAEEA